MDTPYVWDASYRERRTVVTEGLVKILVRSLVKLIILYLRDCPYPRHAGQSILQKGDCENENETRLSPFSALLL